MPASDLASMLKDGGGMPPPGPDSGPPMGDSDDAGGAPKMAPDQAIKILQHFQIPPDPKVLQMVCDAAEVGLQVVQQQGQGGPDEGAPPPGPGGPPPPPGA